jgi:hypothetical protein
MRIAASILPPVTSQPQLQQRGEQGKSDSAREVFAELVDDNLSVPRKVVTEIDSAAPQVQLLRDRIDLTLMRDQVSTNNELPLLNQRALATYQSVATNSAGFAGSVVGLDIIV